MTGNRKPAGKALTKARRQASLLGGKRASVPENLLSRKAQEYVPAPNDGKAENRYPLPSHGRWPNVRLEDAQDAVSPSVNFDLYCYGLSHKYQLVHKEKQAPYALPVSHHDGEGTLRHRPTQGWTVDEAGLLCKVIYLLRPSSLGLDGGGIQHTHPWRLNEACT